MGKKKYFSLFTLGIIIPVSTILIASCSSLNNSNITLPSDAPSENPSNNSQNQNTKIVSTLKSSQIGWENKTKLDIYQQYQSNPILFNNTNSSSLNDFVFQNRNIFIQGNITLIKDSKFIESKLVPWNNSDNDISSLTLSLTIKANSWYLNNEVQKVDLVQSIEITNLKLISNWINSSGGYIDKSNKLTSSKYAEVLKVLNLNYLTPLHKLNNNEINQELHKIEKFSNLNLSIISGSSTSEGKLLLKLSGTYNINSLSVNINSDITINGFLKINQNFDLSFQNFKMDFTNWFNDNRPILNSNVSSITNIDKNDWLNKYILDFKAYNNQNNWTKQEFLNFGFNFTNFKASIINNSNLINFNINGSYTNKKYNGSSWIEDYTIQWHQSNLNIDVANLKIPNIDDVQKWLINSIEIDENLLIQHYPSYYLGLQSWSESIDSSTYYSFEYLTQTSKEIIKKIENNYFSQTPIGIKLNKDVEANDFENLLNFSLFIQVGNDANFNSIRKFSFKNIFNKNLNNLPKNNLVAIKPLNDKKNNWFNTIIRYLKTNHKDLIDNIITSNANNTINIDKENKRKFILPIINNNPLISSSDWPNQGESVNDNFNKISNHITPAIFNQELKLIINDRQYPFKIKQGDFNYELRLYNFSNNINDAFYIQDVRYIFQDIPLLLNLKKTHNQISIEFEAITSISFASGELREYPTTFIMIMTENEWKTYS